MSFTDKLKKSVQDATRVGSPELDKRRENEGLRNIGAEIDSIKREIGELVYISYKRGDPVDQQLIPHCKKIEDLIDRGNEPKDFKGENPQSDSGNVDSYDESGRIN